MAVKKDPALPEDIKELQDKYLEIKAIASEHSGDKIRLSKELGAAQDEIADLKDQLSDYDELEDELSAAAAQIGQFEKELAKAGKAADEGDKAVAAARAVAENLAVLTKL